MELDAQRLALGLRAAADSRSKDPLERYLFPSVVHRAVGESFAAGLRTHHRAANLGAKTSNASALVVATLEDRGSLGVGTFHGKAPNATPVFDGPIRLPKFGRAVRAAVFVQSYDGQVDSSQRWLLDHIGDHDHEIAWMDRGRNIIRTIWIRPFGWRSNNVQTWSRLTFFSQENATEASIKGQRWDLVWMDEPGRRDFWEESLKNALFHLISETPIHADEWEWIAEEFRGALGVPDRGRVEFVSDLWDNGYLTREQVRLQDEKYGGKPEYRARMLGEYLNLDGLCPYAESYSWMETLLSWADEPEPWPLDPRLATWRDREVDVEYAVLCDPSAGLRATPDDPVGGDRCALWVARLTPPVAGVARFFGWLQPHELARMALAAANYYNTALLVWERNGVGEAGLPILDGYINLFREYTLEHNEKKLSPLYGWYSTEQTKAACIGALQRALTERWLDIPCAEAVRSLMAMRYDRNGKLARKPGQNHEDNTTLGMLAYIAAHPAYQVAIPARLRKPKTPTEAFFRGLSNEMGRTIKPHAEARGAVDRWTRGGART